MSLTSISCWILSAVSVISILWYCAEYLRRRCYPPGPLGVPFLGYLPFIEMKIYKTVEKLRPKYGNIITLKLFLREFVFIRDYETVKEAFVGQKEAFAGRPFGNVRQQFFNPNMEGLAMSFGPKWEILRRFSLRVLRDFGLGRSISEEFVLQEFNILKQNAIELEGAEFDPASLIEHSVSSVTCAIIFGFHEGDDYYNDLHLAASENLQSGMFFSLSAEILMWIKFLIPFERSIRNIFKIVFLYNKAKLDERKLTFDADVEPRDFMDAFLKERHVTGKEGGDADDKVFSDDQLVRTLMDLFVAGSETTATTLKWALLALSLRPDVQEKVFQELSDEIGVGNEPTMKHRGKTPYTEAVIHEVMRFHTIAPLTLPHVTTRDVTVDGKHIPKGVTVFASIYSIHYDPRFWRNDLSFDPNNFLDDAGRQFKSNEHFIPFSIGKRACLGEALAKTELYIFFTSIFLNFRVVFGSRQESSTEDILSGTIGRGISCPRPFKVRLEQRIFAL